MKGESTNWRDPLETPDTARGCEQAFIVAVRRAHSGKVYTFPACYLNAYPLRYEYECPRGDGCEGNGCEDGCPTTGWHDATGDGDDGTTYSRLHFAQGDEFLGWCELPKWTDAALSAASPTKGGDA